MFLRALAWPAAALAASLAPAAPATITPEQARTAVDEIIRLVGTDYVFPDQRAPISSSIRAAQEARRYDTSDPEQLAQRITADLRAASRDKHLWVAYDPEAYRDLLEHKDDDTGATPYLREVGRRRNQGYEEVKILDGNIRYARITGFLWSNDATGRVIDEAARFLGDGDAVVIDLRGNGGGSGNAVERLISYFFPGESVVLMTFHDGLTAEDTVARVSNDLPSPRMVGKPLYVLIDGRTASAAEEFAYHVQQFRLGTLVGEKTAGAANNNTRFPVAPGFVASVSVGRPVHPVSRANWEGVGVSPDVATPTASALDQAQVLALGRLAEKAAPADRAALEWPRVAIEARLHPIKVASAQLQGYAGKYGIRSVRLENGALVYQRDGGDPTTLIPMAADLFAFANTSDVRVRFRRSGGKVVGFDQVTADGQIFPIERTP